MLRSIFSLWPLVVAYLAFRSVFRSTFSVFLGACAFVVVLGVCAVARYSIRHRGIGRDWAQHYKTILQRGGG